MKKNLFLSIALLSLTNIYAQCWNQIETGINFTVGLKTDGTIWGWGENSLGILGGAIEQVTTPIQIGNDSNWLAISLGSEHILALKTDNTLWAWGRNDHGQLGNNEITTDPNLAPIQIGTDNDWAIISAGSFYSTAIKTDGTLWTWGSNIEGQLGNGITDVDLFPITVPVQVGTDTDWSRISASYSRNVAIKTNGTLWEWGKSMYTPMSNGSLEPVTSPIQIGLENDWVYASVGTDGISAIKNDGTLWSWGYNFFGGVGDGTTTDRLTPVQIGTDTWKSVKKGLYYYTVGIQSDGTLWTWGKNNNGTLGDGTTVDKITPTFIESEEGWARLSCGPESVTAVKTNGTLWLWGYNYSGNFGFNIEGNPVLVPTEAQDSCENSLNIENNLLENLTVFPNPTNEVVNVVLNEIYEDVNLTVYNITGQVIYTKAYGSTQTLNVNINGVNSGIYFLEIKTVNGKTGMLKVVKN